MAQARFDSSKDHEAKAQPQQTLSCRYCNAPTARDTLSLLGARCSACYEAYCRESMKDRVGPDPRAVKRALARRPGAVVPAGTPVQDVLARQRLSRARVREYALELGLDIPDDDDSQRGVSGQGQDAQP